MEAICAHYAMSRVVDCGPTEYGVLVIVSFYIIQGVTQKRSREGYSRFVGTPTDSGKQGKIWTKRQSGSLCDRTPVFVFG